MTKISRIAPNPRHLGIFIDNFWNGVTLLESKDETKTFLKDLLTHTETKMFAKRIQIAKMLFEGYNYQTIRNYVKVTNGTIAHINNLLNTSGNGLKLIVLRLIKLEEKRKREIEGIDKPIFPKRQRSIGPILAETAVNLVKQEFKKRSKRKTVQVEPL